MQSEIEIIIPTLALPTRRESLSRAVQSVLSQSGVRTAVTLVVNGDKFDQACVDQLRQESRINVCWVIEPGLPGAIVTGWNATSANLVGFLDDDDIFLPNGLARMRDAAGLDGHADVVVANGYSYTAPGRPLEVVTKRDRTSALMSDPLLTLVQKNWFASCCALYRKERIGSDLFDNLVPWCEWTLVAGRLAISKRIAFVWEPCYQVNDTLESASKSEQSLLARERVLKEMIDLCAQADRQDVGRELRNRFGAMYHAISNLHHERDRTLEAWRYHLRSLIAPKGLQYLSYTRHLLGRLFERTS